MRRLRRALRRAINAIVTADAWVRLFAFGFCPLCNSSAPEYYDCPVCETRSAPITRETRLRWWATFCAAIRARNQE